ncbi:MAG: type II toxin-antitoxin system VapC family toxin, partial [Burkholderiales bacterium]
GIYNSQHIERNLNAVHALVDNFSIIEFDTNAAELYGKIKAQLKPHGILISDNDLLIGCHALALQLALVSNNIREYQRIPGLTLENWV